MEVFVVSYSINIHPIHMYAMYKHNHVYLAKSRVNDTHTLKQLVSNMVYLSNLFSVKYTVLWA